jgi:hypothetical protein
MTTASSVAAGATLPQHQLWGVGWYDVNGQPSYFDVSWEDWRRDTSWIRTLLAEHGINAVQGKEAGGLVIVSGLPESPWFDPAETAVRELGAPYSVGEIHAFEAFRTALYVRRLSITAIFGINMVVAEGLGDDLVEVVAQVPVIFARPDAAAMVAAAGGQPYIVARVGPALAIECPQRSGAHVNNAEWSLAERNGELLVTTAGPRAARLSDAATGVRGTIETGRCACGREGQRVRVTSTA